MINDFGFYAPVNIVIPKLHRKLDPMNEPIDKLTTLNKDHVGHTGHLTKSSASRVIRDQHIETNVSNFETASRKTIQTLDN